MFETLMKKIEGERLGSAFAVLLATLLGIGSIALSGGPTNQFVASVSSEIDIEGPISADSAGLMLGGHDPVAYFLDGRPRLGVKAWSARWGQAVFRFASEENRDAFLADPTQFFPQFGGHDAEGVRLGELRRADPNAFVIFEDRLYLLENARTQAQWEEDRQLNSAVADRVWPRLLHLRSGEREVADLSSPGFDISTASTR